MSTELMLVHVGINEPDDLKRRQALERLALFTGFEIQPYAEGIDFVGETFEVMRNGRGTVGHLAFGVRNVAGAKELLESKGFSFSEESALYDDEGQLRFIYANEEVLGFALHLVRA